MKKIIFILLLAFSLQSPTLIFADECMEGDCDDGIGTGFTEEGKIYSGERKNGLPHGVGTLSVSKGKQIEGQWKKGILVEEKKK